MNKEQLIALLISLYLHLLILYIPIDNHNKKTYDNTNTHYISLIEPDSLEKANKIINANKVKSIKGKQDYKPFSQTDDKPKIKTSNEEKTNIIKDTIALDKVIKNTVYDDIKSTDDTKYSLKTTNNVKEGRNDLANLAMGSEDKIPLSDNNFDNVILNAEFGKESGPSFKNRVIPEYPALAKKFRKSGEVVLLLLIDEKGNLKNIEVLKSDDFGFIESAISAIKRSTYIPATIDGKPVSSKAKLTIKFVLK